MTKDRMHYTNNTPFVARPSYATLFIKIGKNNDALRFAICHSLTNILFEETYLEIVEHSTNFVLDKLFDKWNTSIFVHKLMKCKNDIITFFIEKLSEGYYITCYSDDYYFKGSPNYGKQHFKSEHLMYGFDNDKKAFLVISFCNSGLKTHSVPFDRYISTLCGFYDDAIPFSYSRLNPDNDYSANVQLIKQNINDYVNSNNRFFIYDSFKKAHGFDAIRKFYSYLNTLFEKKSPITINDCLLLLDHKKMFAKRLEYLEELGIISPDQWSMQFSPIIEMANEQLDYCQSYNKRLSTNEPITCLFPFAKEIIIAEESLLKRLLENGFKYDN